MKMLSQLSNIGFPYHESVICLFEGGSRLHGAKLEGTDDTDWYGVFIEPSYKALGVDSYEHFVYTTGGKEGGNTFSDVDVTLYSLEKWARLACKGNPSVLHFLFAEQLLSNHYLWARVRVHRDAFFAKQQVGQFIGYANAQMMRLLNKRSKDVNRPFLEAQYGYDTKHAMHLIRLLQEAKEFLETGNIILPRPNREELIAIRTGKYKLYELTEWANQLEVEALKAADLSLLPERVDRQRVSELIAGCYLEYYSQFPAKARSRGIALREKKKP